MLKKLMYLTVVLSVVVIFYASSYAIDVYGKNAKSNLKNPLVKITQPSGVETIFGNSYVVCGITKQKNVRMKLLKYNRTSKTYVNFNDSMGNCVWPIGPAGIIMKEIKLPYYGVNKLRVICYLEGNTKNVQINNYIITALKESFKNVLKNGTGNFSDVMWYKNK